MGLTLGNLDTRFQLLVGDSASTNQTNRYNALADADMELSRIKGFWRLASHTYTTISSPSMSANSYQLSVPTDLESPHRLYYRRNGIVQDVRGVSPTEWLELSDTSRADYPSVMRFMQTAGTKRIELNVLLSSDFVTTIASLPLEYWKTPTRLSASGDESILPDSLRHHILPMAAWFYGLAQHDPLLVTTLRPEMERAKAEVLKFDLEHVSRARQLRPVQGYAPEDDESLTSDYAN